MHSYFLFTHNVVQTTIGCENSASHLPRSIFTYKCIYKKVQFPSRDISLNVPFYEETDKESPSLAA